MKPTWVEPESSAGIDLTNLAVRAMVGEQLAARWQASRHSLSVYARTVVNLSDHTVVLLINEALRSAGHRAVDGDPASEYRVRAVDSVRRRVARLVI